MNDRFYRPKPGVGGGVNQMFGRKDKQVDSEIRIDTEEGEKVIWKNGNIQQ